VKLTVGRAAVSAAVGPLWLAQELGLFAKYGLTVEETVLRSAGAVEAALLSNEIQFGYTGLAAALTARAGGAEVALIASPVDVALSELIVRPDIRQPSDLRGRIMGVQSLGGTIHARGLLALQRLGLDPERDNIKVIVAGDDPTLVQSVIAGAVDAVPVSISGAQVARAQGMHGWDLSELGVPEIGLCVVTTSTTLRDRPEVAERFLKAIAEAVHFIRQGRTDPAVRDRARQIIATRLQLTTEQVAPELDKFAEYASPTLSARPEAVADVVAIIARSAPAVEQVPIDTVVDRSVIAKLERDGFFASLERQ
jgi:ABC-type nitrate/sulfonate/bicarbonate transport system substrate-binding protein